MKPFLFCALFFLGLSFSATAQTTAHNTGGLQWYTNLDEARKLSDASKKPIFAFFTGSDWCGWCHKLEADVFAKTAFIDWAKKNVILLELDFPRRKQLPADLVQQNQSLQQAFGIKGYPTIWMFFISEDGTTKNLNINALGSLGYPSGSEIGKEEVKFLTDADRILANGKK